MPRRVTIMPDRNLVIMDGSPFEIDCGQLPSEWRQVEWFGEEGTIETTAGEVTKVTDATPFREIILQAHLKWSRAVISRCAKGEPEPGWKHKMATAEQLLVRIDATTEQLRRELSRGDQAIAGFAAKVESRLRANGPGTSALWLID